MEPIIVFSLSFLIGLFMVIFGAILFHKGNESKEVGDVLFILEGGLGYAVGLIPTAYGIAGIINILIK